MKKIIFISLLILSCFLAESQTPFSQTATNSSGAITNTSVDTMNVTLSTGYSLVAIQPVVTKASGTMAGTSVLYASVNGTNWVATGDTLTLGNSTTNTTIWYVAKPVRYFRIKTGGATTVTGSASAKISVSR